MNFNMFTQVTYMVYLKDIDIISNTNYEVFDENIEEEKLEVDILIDNLRKSNELFFIPFLEAISRLKNYKENFTEDYNTEEINDKLIKKEIITLNRLSVFRYLKIEE